MHGQWLYSDTEQEYYSEMRVTQKFWTGNQENEGCGQIVHKEERGR